MDSNNTWGWVIGIIVVILVILGIWWYVSANPSAPATQTSGTGVTTGVTASTTY